MEFALIIIAVILGLGAIFKNESARQAPTNEERAKRANAGCLFIVVGLALAAAFVLSMMEASGI